MVDRQEIKIFWLEDEIEAWGWLLEAIKDVHNNVEVFSDPIDLARLLRIEINRDENLTDKVIFVIDALVLYAEEVEDWKGNFRSANPGDTGIQFIDVFLRDSESVFKNCQVCVLTQRRLRDDKIQNALKKIDERIKKFSKVEIFSKMRDSSLYDFFEWLETAVDKLADGVGDD